jgi:hypothetical protein
MEIFGISVIRGFEKVAPNGVITTVAGGVRSDSRRWRAGHRGAVRGISWRGSRLTAGTSYISDSANSRIRKVDTSGTVNTYAGTGTNGPAAMEDRRSRHSESTLQAWFSTPRTIYCSRTGST